MSGQSGNTLRPPPPRTTMLTSPSGSLCPYPYMGGELHPLKYGSYHRDKQALLQMMNAEEQFILTSSGEHNRRIWVDLYDTRLDKEAVACLAVHLFQIRPKTAKLCLVGCPALTRWRITSAMRRTNSTWADSVRFFTDPEQAKMWLVGKAD